MKARVFTVGELTKETFPEKKNKDGSVKEPAKDVAKRNIMLHVGDIDGTPNYMKAALWADEAEMSAHLSEGDEITFTLKKNSIKIV